MKSFLSSLWISCQVLLLMVVSHAIKAQSNFQPAKVLLQFGDTVSGFIDHKEWSKNPDKISFKSGTEEAVTELNDTQVRYFEVDGETYVQFNGIVSMDKNTTKRSDILILDPVPRTVWLKIISLGRFVNLYSYRDNIKNRFFISHLGGRPEELIYRLYPYDEENDNKFVVDDRYKSQLTYPAQTAGVLTKKVAWKIKTASYGLQSISDIVDEINGNTNTATARKQSGIYLFVGGGVSRSNLHLTSLYGWTASSQTSYNPYFLVGVDIIPFPNVGRLVLRGELCYSTATLRLVADSVNTGALQVINFTGKQSTTSLTTQAQYNVYNAKNVKCYLGAGLKIGINTYTNDTFYITQSNSTDVTVVEAGYGYNPVWFSANVQAGVMLHQRYEFLASISPPVAITAPTNLLGQSISYSRIGFNYHFNIR